MKLGCNPRPRGVKAPLLLSRYVGGGELPPFPAKVYREYKIAETDWNMFGNDTIGDCTCAAIAHMLMCVTAHTGTMVVPTTADVIGVYSAVSGYDPKTGENDNGSDLPTVLDYWRDYGLAGHKIVQWADVDVANRDAQKYGIWLFGATDDAVQFPAGAMDQTNKGESWDIQVDDGGIDGGHSIPRFGYGSEGATCVTWGKTQPGSWDWWAKYLTESCVVITNDWLKSDGLTPSGFPMDTLVADLKAMGSL